MGKNKSFRLITGIILLFVSIGIILSCGGTGTTADSAPGKPTKVQAVALNAAVTITWTAPTDTGTVSGAAGTITGYKIYYSTTGTVTTSDSSVEVTDPTTLSHTFDNLTNGTAYYFAVTASNGSGEGDLSAPASATPMAGKQDLANIQLSYPAITMDFGATTGNTASPSWAVPDTDVDYSITTPTTATAGRVTIDPDTGTVTVGTDAVGADSGTYTVEATAKGTSTSYTGSVTQDFILTVNAKPGSPTIISATPEDNGDMTLEWDIPTDKGYSGTVAETLTALTIKITDDTNLWSIKFTDATHLNGTTTSYIISGLPSGTQYSFTMTASNTHGESALSAAITGTTKYDLSAATLGYTSTTLTRTYNDNTSVNSGTPSWSGGAGTAPTNPTYRIAAATGANAPTDDGKGVTTNGISIDSSTGVITAGTALEVKHSGDYVVTATAASGDANYIKDSTKTLEVTVTINPVAVTAITDYTDITVTVNSQISTQTGSTTPSGATGTYSISPSLPAGLILDTATGDLSGTPTAATAQETYTITFTASGNYGGTQTDSFALTVNAFDLSTETLTYSDISVDKGASTGNTASPSWSVTHTEIDYSIKDSSQNLVTGVSIGTDGVITVDTSSSMASETYTVSAAAKGSSRVYTGTKTATITIVVKVPVASVSYSASSLTAVLGTGITALSPTTDPSGAVGTYSINPDLATDTGLSFSTTTGEISGTPTKAMTTATTYTITFTASGDYGGTLTTDIDITVEEPTGYEVWDAIVAGAVPDSSTLITDFAKSIFKHYTAGETLVAKYVTKTGAGLKNGTSWDNAAAESDLKSTMDGITYVSGTVYLLLVGSGTYNAGSELEMEQNVATVGGWPFEGGWAYDSSNNVTALDGNSSHRVLTAHSSSGGGHNGMLLHSITVQNGSDAFGAGLRVYRSTVTIFNVVFEGNRAAGHGGAVYLQNSSRVFITQCTFRNNEAGSGRGGGVYVNGSGGVIDDSVFVDNKAQSGGAVYGAGDISTYNFHMHNTTVSNNEATGELGGGCYFGHKTGIATITDSTIVGNTAPTGKSGSGVGVGIWDGQTASSLRIGNSLIWGNHVTGDPGKTQNEQIGFHNRTSPRPDSVFTIANSIVQHGIATDIGGDDGVGVTFSLSGNPVALRSTAIISADPSLDMTLQDNGGPLETHAIPSGSSAIDQGLYVKRNPDTTVYYSSDTTNWYTDPTDTANTGGTPDADAVDINAKDARGYARVGTPDIGAYEFGGTAP